jgi:hypothetical protein
LRPGTIAITDDRAMPDLIIELNLNPGQLLQYYRGAAQVVQARAANGQVVQFPANVLQRHVTKDGIHGQFRLEFDANRKFLGLVPVKSP